MGFSEEKKFNRYLIDFKRVASLSDQEKKIANPAEQFTRLWAMKKEFKPQAMSRRKFIIDYRALKFSLFKLLEKNLSIYLIELFHD